MSEPDGATSPEIEWLNEQLRRPWGPEADDSFFDEEPGRRFKARLFFEMLPGPIREQLGLGREEAAEVVPILKANDLALATVTAEVATNTQEFCELVSEMASRTSSSEDPVEILVRLIARELPEFDPTITADTAKGLAAALKRECGGFAAGSTAKSG